MGDHMKKWLLIAVMCVLLVVVASFAGCFESEATKIEGTFYNNTLERVYVHAKNANTGGTTTWSCSAENARAVTLGAGTYDVTAKWYSNDVTIDSDRLTIEAQDTTFDIIVYNTSVACYSY